MIPRIHLAVDNCFASKRWTEPREWMQIAHDAGITCIEASADNECDPLYNTPDSLQAWLDNVQSASAQTRVKVVNLYSGHGTYATLGLAHTDIRIRDHIQHNWLEPMIHSAAALGAGLGFFCHAFPQSVLADPERYAAAVVDLYTRLSDLASVAERESVTISIEQMYSPHQIPWTISGSQELLKSIYFRHFSQLYLTLDTGHQIGQRRHLQPSQSDIEAYVAAINRGKHPPSIWFGLFSPEADETLPVDALNTYIQEHPYLFAEPIDGDLYAWLRALG
ncbi:MAG: TIM barrel protein, partial [Chloroflexota bacterium]